MAASIRGVLCLIRVSALMSSPLCNRYFTLSLSPLLQLCHKSILRYVTGTFECPSLPRLVHQVSRQFALVVTHLTQFFEVSVMFQQCSDDCTLVYT